MEKKDNNVNELELVCKVVRDIHISPQNPIETFKSYFVTNNAVLYNLLNGNYKYTQGQFINICLDLDRFVKYAIQKLEQEFR